MLVLGRGKGQSVDLTVGDVTVRVYVSAINDRQVRLAFDAPPSVKIMRSELWQRAGSTDRPTMAEGADGPPCPRCGAGKLLPVPGEPDTVECYRCNQRRCTKV